MFHPLIRLIAAKPHLLTAHLAAYADLVGVQTSEALTVLRSRALLAAGMGVCAALGLGLAGVAVLIAAAIPLQGMPAPWLLAALPALPLLGAALCWWALRQGAPAWSADALRNQWAADAALLQAAGEA